MQKKNVALQLEESCVDNLENTFGETYKCWTEFYFTNLSKKNMLELLRCAYLKNKLASQNWREFIEIILYQLRLFFIASTFQSVSLKDQDYCYIYNQGSLKKLRYFNQEVD